MSSVSWIRQSALIYEADLAWLCGNKKFALEKVRELREVIDEKPVNGIQGRLARWEIVSAIVEGKPMRARSLFQEWYESLDQLDAIDQAEVLCGLAYMARFRKSGSNGFADQARKALAKLPAACSRQLERLGLPLPH